VKRSLIVPVLLVLVSACSSVQFGSSGGNDGGTNASVDSSALTSLVLTDLNGEQFEFGKFVGDKVIMVSFWATFCKPCRSEMPFLQKLHETYADKGLQIVSISQDTPDTEAMVKPFIRKNRYTFPVCIDRQSEATQLLNAKSVLPYLVVFDRTGKVVKEKDGFSVGDQPGLEKLVKELLDKGQ